MAKDFIIKKRLPLDFLGAEWAECFIDFRPFSIREVTTISDLKADDPNATRKILDLLKTRFEGGKGYNGQLVDLEADDIEDLPVEVLSRAVSFLIALPDPK